MSIRHHLKAGIVAGVAVSTALVGLVTVSSADAAAPASCVKDVDGTGLSAAVVAHSNQTIAHRTIATSCDIGIYVGPAASHVRIKAVRISGANFQGILVQKTSHVTIEGSTIKDNGLNTIDPKAPVLPGSGLQSFVGQSFGISLFGVSHAIVRDNTVVGNGRGGIGVMDNGPNNPGAINQNTKAPVVGSTYIDVNNNRIRGNYGGCALVVATQNVGGFLARVRLEDNVIVGTGMSKTMGPDVGGLVVAANPPGSWLRNVKVIGNRISNSFEGGVVVNAEAFNAYTRNVVVVDNILRGNNWGAQEAPKTAGVIVFANPGASGPPGSRAPRNVATVVAGNRITDQYYGIYSVGSPAPLAAANSIVVTSGGTKIANS